MARRRTFNEKQLWNALERCGELAELGKHGAVIRTAEAALRLGGGRPELEADLLVWKAQACLELGRYEDALNAAEQAWERAPSAEASYAVGASLAELGELEEAEKMLQMGIDLFPEEPFLHLRLAMLLADEGRVPEALDHLDAIDESSLDEESGAFLAGIRAGLLGSIGEWEAAAEVLDEGLEEFPDEDLLYATSLLIEDAQAMNEAEEALAEAWRTDLEPVEHPVAMEVDDAIVDVAASLELPELVVLAARRLWRAFFGASPIRRATPEAWAVALIVAISELDGQLLTVAPLARATGTRAEAVRRALGRIRTFLGGIESELARRRFAVATNPRLAEGRKDPEEGGATVVRFPGTTPKGGSE